MASRNILTVENLFVSLPLPAGELRAVNDVSLRVGRGETLCIVGESGCGKSLMALSLMNLLPRNAKRMATRLDLDGIDLLSLSERRMSDLRGDRVAMIFQEPMTSLNPSYTIGNQLEEALLRHRTVSRRQARVRAVELLAKVGIPSAEERLGQFPHQLSGGLRQRVMIAMALMCGPDLIIADEPTTALDVTIQAQILHLLADLKREFGAGLLLITHDLGVVARIADRVAVMYAGEVVEVGATETVFANPSHPYTMGLLACIPVPGKTRRGAKLGSIPGSVPSLIGRHMGCRFASRCPHTAPRCTPADIPLTSWSGTHATRCIFPPDQVSSLARTMEMA